MAVQNVFLNENDKDAGITITDNLKVAYTGTNGNYRAVRANVSRRTGKWYFEFYVTSLSSYINGVGIATATQAVGGFSASTGFTTAILYGNNAVKVAPNQTGTAYGTTYVNGDTIGVLMDLDGKSIEFTKNGVSQGVLYSNLTEGDWFPYIVGVNNTFSGTVNFGATPFKQSKPAGYTAYAGEWINRASILSNQSYLTINKKDSKLIRTDSINADIFEKYYYENIDSVDLLLTDVKYVTSSIGDAKTKIIATTKRPKTIILN